MIPERYLIECEKVQAEGAAVGDLLGALRRQHTALDACNDRLRKARTANERAD